MAKKSRDTGKVDNDLKKRLRANMKARREDRKCYAFGMAINPKMKPVLGKKHRALLVVKSEDLVSPGRAEVEDEVPIGLP